MTSKIANMTSADSYKVRTFMHEKCCAIANTIKPFRLLDLPPEIWSNIGKLVVDETETITAYIIYQCARAAEPADTRQPAVTRTCRILRSELLAYYYKHKVDARMTPTSAASPKVGKWLRAIGQQNRMVISNFWGIYYATEAQVGQPIRDGFEKELQVEFEFGETKPFDELPDIGWGVRNPERMCMNVRFI